MSTITTTTSTSSLRTYPSLRAAWVPMAALCLAFFVEMVDNTLLSIALPTIGRDLGPETVTGPRVTKAVIAVDTGLVINPRGLEAQMQGAGGDADFVRAAADADLLGLQPRLRQQGERDRAIKGNGTAQALAGDLGDLGAAGVPVEHRRRLEHEDAQQDESQQRE